MTVKKGEFLKAGRDYVEDDVDAIPADVVDGLVERLSERGVPSRVFWWYMVSQDSPGKLNWRQYVLGGKFWEDFDKYLARAQEMADTQAGIELKALERELRYWEDPEKVLTWERLSAGPLARYLMGNYLGFPELVERYREKAVHQLLERPWFFKSFGKLREHFPITLKEVDL